MYLLLYAYDYSKHEDLSLSLLSLYVHSSSFFVAFNLDLCALFSELRFLSLSVDQPLTSSIGLFNFVTHHT